MTSPDWTDEQVDAVLGAFDTRTLQRARSYATNGMITGIDWSDGVLTGVSLGSGEQRYRCKVTAAWDGPKPRVSASCTCPVAIRCKHCAALVMAATAEGTAVARRSSSAHSALPLSRWRTLIDEISKSSQSVEHTPDGPELPLALQFSVHRSYRGADSVRLRPLTMSEQGRWVKTRVTWKTILSGKTADRHPEKALDVLTRLASALAISGQSASIGDEMSLLMAPPSIWVLLDEARDAGVEFVNARSSKSTTVEYGDHLSTRLHVTAQRAGVHVALEVLVDGRPVPPDAFQFPIGRPRAHGIAQEVGDVLYIGPLPRLTTTESMLLVSRVPLEVSDDELGDFREALPTLQADRAVVVEPGAFPAADLAGPFPVLRIETGEHPCATWSTAYETDGEVHEFPTQGTETGRFRNAAAERAMWDEVRPELEMVARSSAHWVAAAADLLERRLPKYRSDYRRFNRVYAVLRQLRGGCTVAAAFDSLPELRTVPVPLSQLEVAILCAETVPKITELGRVRVDVVGTPPDYRPAEAPPVLSFSGDGDARSDWFDLRVALDVDGHKIPITTIISALASGETHMVLDDGTYFALDIPALQTLRDRLDEAREMGELDGDRVSTHTLNASLWDELLELGVVDEQLRRWRDRIARLAAARPPHSVPPPAGVDARLRPYQQEGLDWLTFLWDNELGGVLADDMGLGKTVQTLALIQRVVDERPDARFLVVAPTSVIANWAAEIHRFVPGLEMLTVPATEKRVGTPLADRIADARIVVTSYALLRIDYDAFARVPWTGAIFDEAQFLKNHNSKTYQAARRLQAPFKLAITGTPMENRVMELWSLVSVVAPGLYSSPKLFKEHFADAIESGQAPERLAILRRRLRPIMLRRTKDQVLVDLPEKQEQLLPIELEPKHRKVYDTYLARDRQQLLGLLEDFDGNRIQVLRALTRLRQLSLHPALVDDEHAAVNSAKIEYLSEQLPILIDEGHSALVFSSFTGFLKLIAARLDAAGIAYSYLDGSTAITRRGEQIEQFTHGRTRVFLISLKAGGFGLNLTAADYCFMTDPWWNPAAENQAVDRAHRIGQHRAVTVYRMVSTGTIEEKVIDLQNRKRELFDALLDDGAAFSGAITAEDVRGLLG
ncbi:MULTISPECIES: DEAD/DEAH box helicase [Gordonia]|uniref:Helicase n=1 Tax=Gordonia cholesterolivorans TaxID=559625 RepID=A0ABN3HBP9_9ACTN|nr:MULTISPECIES: DEAD/DEAH box helicase [Gordonia]KJR06539.1 helicase [Gordonia sihwensis]KXT55978.1 helicase [Gordonia sp. QH-12]